MSVIESSLGPLPSRSTSVGVRCVPSLQVTVPVSVPVDECMKVMESAFDAVSAKPCRLPSKVGAVTPALNFALRP